MAELTVKSEDAPGAILAAFKAIAILHVKTVPAATPEEAVEAAMALLLGCLPTGNSYERVLNQLREEVLTIVGTWPKSR